MTDRLRSGDRVIVTIRDARNVIVTSATGVVMGSTRVGYPGAYMLETVDIDVGNGEEITARREDVERLPMPEAVKKLPVADRIRRAWFRLVAIDGERVAG